MKGQPRREAEVGAAISEEQDLFQCCEGEYRGCLSDQGIHDRQQRGFFIWQRPPFPFKAMQMILPGGGVAG